MNEGASVLNRGKKVFTQKNVAFSRSSKTEKQKTSERGE